MEIILRQESAGDHQSVFEVIEKAFKNEVLSDHREHFLVDNLRKTNAFIPELSIVAEIDEKIVGHILLSKIKIINKENEFESLALAPVSVHPDFQNIGIGALLIKKSHQIAKELGYKSIILLGHENYYPKFGYTLAGKYDITLPFDVPKENCMAIELVENGLSGINGMVEYSIAFINNETK
jgi:predicted N-acetyltransferase YhbS